MSTPQPASAPSISLYDARLFFEKALQFGVTNGIIPQQKLDAICTDAPKGMVQIARYFGTEFLRPELEVAKNRMVNLVSLYLENASEGDLQQAAQLLRDQSFLSCSKGGSDLLKGLLALPQSTNFDSNPEADGFGNSSPVNGPVNGLAEWSLKTLNDYREEFARRYPVKLQKDAALWLAEHLGMEIEALEDAHTHAEAVIRTALLVLAVKRNELPDWVEFEKMVTALRKKYLPAKEVAAKTTSAKPLTLTLVAPKNLPDEFKSIVEALRLSVIADLPKILEDTRSARKLFAKDRNDQTPPLFGRYFWVEDIASEIDHHDRSISKAWDKATGGSSDDGSLLTLFVCIAANATAKTLLTEKAATALIRKIQKTGFHAGLALQYIEYNAPAEHKEAYTALWEDFIEEAADTLVSDSTFALNDALALLRRECNVKG